MGDAASSDVDQPDTAVLDTAPVDKEAQTASDPTKLVEWITGWRVAAIVVGQILSLFMIQTESSITSTAIASITDELGQFERSSWVFSAYLLTYGAFPILLAKMSDILGRKQVLLGCVISFVILSGACGSAQSMLQLIMFRWIKGLGAGGISAICTGYGFELRPPEKWPSYSVLTTVAAAISVSTAPLIGAALTQAGQWRWCFIINVPIGATATILLVLTMPEKLRLEPAARLADAASRIRMLLRIDVFGALLFVGAAVALMASLQQAAEGIPFNSPRVIALLVLAPILLFVYLVWQWLLSHKTWNLDPVVPCRLITNRIFMAAVCNAWLSGMVMVVTIIQIPQRFMIVNGLSAIDAGVRLLPYTAVMASTSAVVALIMTKSSFTAMHSLLFGALLQVAGVTGLSQASVKPAIEAPQFVFQILVGIGVGICNVVLLFMTPHVVEKGDLGVGNGAINQFRILGGSLGLSIVTCASSGALRSDLVEFLGQEQTTFVLDRTERILSLSPDNQRVVREAFGHMYNRQMYILIGIAACQFFTSLIGRSKQPIVLKR